MTEFDLSILDYNLPKELIAQYPANPRDSARLMVLNGDDVQHTVFSELRRILEPGDVLILNRTKVIPARLYGKKESGGKVQILLIRKISQNSWKCLVGGKIRDGTRILFDCAEAVVHGEGTVRIAEFSGINDFDKFLREYGNMPTPPYIKKPVDPEKYQCVFAQENGSIAAPTAGLHFTEELISDLKEKGVSINYITLHIGAGTFIPDLCKTEPEFYSVPAETVASVEECKGRVLYCGTTTMKAMESAAGNDGLAPAEGVSTIFICPGYRFKNRIDALITNFHPPKSSLLALTCAFGGTERILKAYREAVTHRYRFYSLGDAMLIWR